MKVIKKIVEIFEVIYLIVLVLLITIVSYLSVISHIPIELLLIALSNSTSSRKIMFKIYWYNEKKCLKHIPDKVLSLFS